MSIKKQYLKTKPICKITFSLPQAMAESAENVHLVGEFNNWNTSGNPMKRLKNGSFSVSINLELNREYQFRYLIDSLRWENDREADKYIPTPFEDCNNSVVVV